MSGLNYLERTSAAPTPECFAGRAFLVGSTQKQDVCLKTNLASLTNWKTIAWGYNWYILFLEKINTGTWPFRLGKSQI
jgi:hypothetical protein